MKKQVKNILYYNFTGQATGPTKILIDMAKLFSNMKDFNVIILAPKSNFLSENLRNLPKVKYYSISPYGRMALKGFKFYISIFGFIYNLIKVIIVIIKEKIDIIHVNSLVSLEAVIGGKILGKKVITHIHEVIKDNKISNLYIKLLDVFTSEYLAVSNFVKNRYSDISKKRITKINNAIETVIEPSYPTKLKNIGMLGLLVPEKGAHIFIDAAKLILKQNSNLKFLLGGDIPNKKYLWYKDKLLNDIGKFECMKYCGFIKDIFQWIKNLDVLIVPSIIKDSSPMVVLEGMIMGKPVIGSNIGGIPGLIDNNETGLLFNPDDFHDLKEKILTLKNRDITQMGKKAREKALREHSLEQLRSNLLSIYEMH